MGIRTFIGKYNEIYLGTQKVERLSKFLAALGHGRMIELFLGTLKIGLGIWVAKYAITEPAIADLSWMYSSFVLAVPLLCVGVIQIASTVLNCAGFEFSWIFRTIGAQIAIFMWFWFIFKTSIAGVSSPLFVVGIVSIPFSMFLLYKGWNRLPIPGAPGAR